MPDPRLNALRQLAGRAMDADGDYDDSSGLDSPAEERAEYDRVRIPMRDVRGAIDPRMAALNSLAGRPSDPLLNRAVPGYDDIPMLEDMTTLPGGRTAAIDDLEAAGMMTDALWRKTRPSVADYHFNGSRAPMSMKQRDPGATVPKGPLGRDASSAAMSADRAAYGPPAERELTDAEYDEMQRMAAARARIERERATAAAAVPYSSGYAQPRGAGASRATTGQAQMTPEQIARIEANRRLYEGR